MIEEFGLHDATLVDVHLIWEKGLRMMTLRHLQLSDCTLTFTNVSNLILPRLHPWGPSVSIDSASQTIKGWYRIDMQSGDVIEIDASQVTLAPLIQAL